MDSLIVLAIFIVLGIVRTIIQKSQEGQQPQRPGPMVAPDRRQQVQSEIDAFLKDVGATPRQQGVPPQKREGRPRQQAPPQRPRPQQSPRPQQVPRPASQPKPTMQQRAAQRTADDDRTRQRANQKPGRNITDRTIVHEVGSGIDRHVQTYMANQIDSAVDNLVQVDIVSSVDSHLGKRKSQMPKVTARAVTVTAANSLRDMLKDPKGIRNALLLNEILSRPRALRD